MADTEIQKVRVRSPQLMRKMYLRKRFPRKTRKIVIVVGDATRSIDTAIGNLAWDMASESAKTRLSPPFPEQSE